MVSIIGHKLQRLASSWLYICTELNQFWLCSNSILGLRHTDEILVTKTMVEMTKCYFKCRQRKLNNREKGGRIREVKAEERARQAEVTPDKHKK